MINYKEINEIYKKSLKEQEQELKEEAGRLVYKLNEKILQDAKAGYGYVEYHYNPKVIRVLKDYYKAIGFEVKITGNRLVIIWD